MNFDTSALIYECYIDNVLLLQGQNKCWLNAVREILHATGFHQVWLDQNTQDKTHLVTDVRKKLEEIYQEQWKLEGMIAKGTNYEPIESLTKSIK